MAGVYIACQDALTIIDQWDSPQTLFYCDPPYPDTQQGHYGGYTVEDYALLVEKLDAAAGNIVLSCYDVPGVTIPDDWEKFNFSARMSAKACRRDETGQQADRGETERTELVYRRFNRVPVRLEIQRLYDSGAYNCFAFPPGDRRQAELF
jgi:site-specific DNA-adenine methylase